MFLKLCNLFLQIGADAIELLSHCLGKNFYFGANLNRGYLAKRYSHTRHLDRRNMWQSLSKCCVSPPRFLADSPVLRVQYAASRRDSRDELSRSGKIEKIFIEVGCNTVTL